MAEQTFFFYDLETSGVDPRLSRIMQFAGQRTTLDLKPVGDPYNLLIKLTPDILPSPDALLITGITPQQTVQDGITEAEFIKLFDYEINQPGTIFTGFNNIRFDDEFMRFTFYRNFYDAYGWQWQDGRSRWDLLDVVRITRALRPEGIEWPFAPDGKPTNRLELLTELNKLEHSSAHDAMSDVEATIAIAGLIRQRQPKLFSYLFSMRDKRAVKKLVESGEPFLYVSGKYASEYEKLAIVSSLGMHPDKGGALVYDLRYDPTEYLEMSPEQLVEVWRYKKDSDEKRLPIKTLKYNRCPAIAPTSVLLSENSERLKIDLGQCRKHKELIDKSPAFYKKIIEALQLLDKERAEQRELIENENQVDSRLYEGFVSDKDRGLSEKVRRASPDQLQPNNFAFHDSRLEALLPLYKARNFPKALSPTEKQVWDKFKNQKQREQLPYFSERFEALSQKDDLTKDQSYILEEIKLYVEDILS